MTLTILEKDAKKTAPVKVWKSVIMKTANVFQRVSSRNIIILHVDFMSFSFFRYTLKYSLKVKLLNLYLCSILTVLNSYLVIEN